MVSKQDGVQLAAELMWSGQQNPVQQLLALGFPQGQIPAIIEDARLLTKVWSGRK